MHTHTCIYIYIYIHVYIHIYIYMYIYVYRERERFAQTAARRLIYPVERTLNTWDRPDIYIYIYII